MRFQSLTQHLRTTLPLAFLAAASLLGSRASADLITFETTPNGSTPVDNAPLADPYSLTDGGSVRFFFDTNGNNAFDSGTDILPRFEQVGDADPVSGFYNRNLDRNDIANPGFRGQLGNWFLRQPGDISSVPGNFIIDYNTTQTISEFSGEIWDIDAAANGDELWIVEALSVTNTVLGSVRSPRGTNEFSPLDGRPWVFALRNLPIGVDKIRLRFAGTKPDGVGLAFNNFSPFFAIPEPSSVVLIAIGLVGAGAWTRRRRRHA